MPTEVITLPSGTRVTVKTRLTRRDKKDLQKLLFAGVDPSTIREGEQPKMNMENILEYRFQGVLIMVVGMKEEQIDAMSDEDIQALETRFDELSAQLAPKKKSLTNSNNTSSETAN